MRARVCVRVRVSARVHYGACAFVQTCVQAHVRGKAERTLVFTSGDIDFIVEGKKETHLVYLVSRSLGC